MTDLEHAVTRMIETGPTDYEAPKIAVMIEHRVTEYARTLRGMYDAGWNLGYGEGYDVGWNLGYGEGYDDGEASV